jgi:hypothetical protein
LSGPPDKRQADESSGELTQEIKLLRDFLPRQEERGYFLFRLRHPNASPQKPRDPLAGGRQLLFVLVLGIGLTFLGIAIIALVCQTVVPPISQDAAFDRQVTVADVFFYSGQPAKTAAFNASCLASPFLLVMGIFLALRWVKKLSHKTLDRLIWIGVGIYLLLAISCAWPFLYCPHPPLVMMPPSWLLLPFVFSTPFCTLERVLFLFMAGGLTLFLHASPPTRQNANRVLVLLLMLWVLLIPSRFYPPSEINDEVRYVYHLNSVLDALSQSINGRHWLVDFPHIYGGYGEFLAPVIRLFPRDIGTLIAALAVPHVLSVLCLLLTARLVIRRPSLLFLCGLSLMAVSYLSSSNDTTYGYSVARVVFPPAGLLAAILYFRHPTTSRYAATTGLAALASIWNLDSGLVLWASWLGTLLVMNLAARNLPGIARHLIMQTLSLGGAWSAFLLYLRLTSGQWPDGGNLLYFHKFVLGTGYFCVPVSFPGMWAFILSIYIIGCAVALCAYARGKSNGLTPVILMTSLLGIGIYSYFMGRSAESNLVAVAYPAVLLAGILCAEVEVLTQAPAKLPPSAGYFLLPCKIALFWWGFLLIAALPDLLTISGDVVRNWRNEELTPLRANAAFVTQRVRPHEGGVFFLSNQSGIYYYLSDTVRAVKIPGMIELMQARDMDRLVDAIRARRINKLFVEQNFYSIKMYRPDIYAMVQEAVAQNYQVSEIGPTGRLVLYTPR